MLYFHKISHGVKTVAENATERKKRGKVSEARWVDCEGGTLPPKGALKGSSFRHLPTKHAWRKSCNHHNNTTAPGQPYTGNLRSLHHFQGMQTHSCCQPRAPTSYRGGKWVLMGETHFKTKKQTLSMCSGSKWWKNWILVTGADHMGTWKLFSRRFH